MTSTILKWVSGGLEAFWGIPILGGTIILSLGWIPLGIMFFLHVATLIFAVREGQKIHGSIIGIVASAVGWIPFLGWGLHVAAAIFILIDAYKTQNGTQTY